MDGMQMSTEAPAKVSVALALQLQVQVSDAATAMISTHMDRDDPAERNRSIDIAHAAAERLHHRYKVTKLGDLIRQTVIAIQMEHERAAKDLEHFTSESVRRALQKDKITEGERTSFDAAQRRGSFKPSTVAAQQLARLDTEHERAASQQTIQAEQSAVNVRKHEHDLAAMRAELEQLEKLLNGANS